MDRAFLFYTQFTTRMRNMQRGTAQSIYLIWNRVTGDSHAYCIWFSRQKEHLIIIIIYSIDMWMAVATSHSQSPPLLLLFVIIFNPK